MGQHFTSTAATVALLSLATAAAASPQTRCRGRLWIKPQDTVVATALLVHGLNLRPQKMESVGRHLAQHGVLVLRVALAGHRDDPGAFSRVTREIWRQELEQCYQLVAEAAHTERVAVHLVAFSLGAVVALDLMHSEEQPPLFHRALLFAPAIETQPGVRLVEPLAIFGRDFVLPSMTPGDYRANPGTPIAAYQALFAGAEAVRRSRHQNSNIPTLVFIDPQDELVSLSRLRQTKQQRGLDQWRLVEVDNSGSSLEGKKHHLIIDEQAVGPSMWSRMKQQMVLFLQLPAAASSATSSATSRPLRHIPVPETTAPTPAPD